MFISFLHPYRIRNVEAPYLWVFYKQLYSFDLNDIYYVGSKQYFFSIKYFMENGRPELTEKVLKYNEYELPSDEKIKKCNKFIIDDSIFEPLEIKYKKSSNLIWKRLLTENYIPLSSVIENIVSLLMKKDIIIEGFISWCNCPSLNLVAEKFNIKVIHNEWGPIRKPMYLSTAYFDLSGVNGNTSAKDRYYKFINDRPIDIDSILSLNELKKMFCRESLEKYESIDAKYDAGIALQVENDSNMLAYSCGFNSINILDAVSSEFDRKKILIRRHPAGIFKYDNDYYGEVDNSNNSLEFIKKCDIICTINSSVGLEALLCNKKVKVFGDAPYKFISEIDDENERLIALNFFMFAYLIPYENLFNINYYRWLLKEKSERMIYDRNKDIFTQIADRDAIKADRDAIKADRDNIKKLYCDLQDKYNKNYILYNNLINSKGVRMLFLLHSVKDKILPYGSTRRKIVKYIYHGMINFIKNKKYISENIRELDSSLEYNIWDYKIDDRLIILTTKHCLFVAEMINDSLKKINIEASIITDEPKEGYEAIPHIVICPQMFKKLPQKYIAYQLEQSVSSRWFNEDYFLKLKKAAVVFDYSISNINYLQMNGIPFSKTYYMPISPLKKVYSFDEDYEYDVLFYGDDKCDRRQGYLEKLKKYFKVKIINNLFGDRLYRELAKAKIIVNIHYYSNALLETTRLSECISLGRSIIISEKTDDMKEVCEFENVIEFVNDCDEMIKIIEMYLTDDNKFSSKLICNNNYINNLKVTSFQYYFYRFLLASDNMSFDQFYDIANEFINFKDNKWCLSLPEAKFRREEFQKDNFMNIELFSGLRHYEGWIGCGLSYKFLLKKAEDMSLENVIICEDDVLFTEKFRSEYLKILNYLDNNREWDVFSGLIADVSSDTNVIDIKKENGIEYIVLDKMVSMVFNIYNKTSYEKIYNWKYENRDRNNNTIDRYLEKNANFRIYTTIPFLVSCKEETQSTLWGFMNSQYSSYIENSLDRLSKKVKKFKMNNNCDV